MPQPSPIHDLIGVGLGPANLALALALRESNADFRILERKPCFGWHRGMLLADATMQIPFLKDLVTQRDPTSPYSFLCYLQARGRLDAFVNLRAFHPTRREFHDYLEWCAQQVADQIAYSNTVVGIDVAPDALPGRPVTELVVRLRHGGFVRQVRTRAVSLALGIAPRMPNGIPNDSRICHTANLLPYLEAAQPAPGARFAVIGGGQSAAEAVMHLLDRDPTAEVHAVMTAFGFLPADDTPFVNEVFAPGNVDAFYAMSPDMRAAVRERHANTNYGVADPEIIAALYERTYREQVEGRRRLHLARLSRLVSAAPQQSGLELHIEDCVGGNIRRLGVDHLICGTGYEPVAPQNLFSDALRALVHVDAGGKPALLRDYRVRTDPRLRAAIYLQGDCEQTHGLSATLLSNLAVRAGEIRDSFLRRAADTGNSGYAETGT